MNTQIIQKTVLDMEVELIVPASTQTANEAIQPLVFLHEGLGSVAMWHSKQGYWPQTICESSNRVGLVYSRRGYGASKKIEHARTTNRWDPHYMHQHALEVLPNLLDELNLIRPTLVGHSDGATIALIYAAHHPTCQGVFAMAPHLFVEDITIKSIEEAKRAFESGDLKEKLQRFHHHVDDAFWLWCDVWLSQEFKSFDIRALVQQITSPVCALQGLDDPYGSDSQIDSLVTQGHLERHFLPHCAHNPHRESQERCNALLLDFLERSLIKPRPLT
jgi:pimeloyl-ACP methyl ester carboxylesterase